MQSYIRDLCSKVFGLDDAVIFDVTDLKGFKNTQLIKWKGCSFYVYVTLFLVCFCVSKKILEIVGSLIIIKQVKTN